MEYTHKATIEESGFIINVFSPVISTEERNARMQAIHKAAENLLKKDLHRRKEK